MPLRHNNPYERDASLIYNRNNTTDTLQRNYTPRGTPTRTVRMPIYSEPANMGCLVELSNDTRIMFAAGADSLPFQGYQRNIDIETKLRNTIFPTQYAAKSQFIPDTTSSLYNNESFITNSQMTHSLLFKQHQFHKFDPNINNIGHQLFHNHTKTQTRNL
jgi:hypothetical protein